MDEPLSALDKKLRERMQIELKQLHRQLGVTTVYVTHDQREALTMSDRIAVINDGQLAQVDTPQAIYNHPANGFVADFIGESTILPLQFDTHGQLSFNGQTLQHVASEGNHNDWSLVIRPERLYFGSPSSTALSLNGIVRESVFQGETAFMLVTIEGGHEVSVRFGTGSMSEAAHLQPGDAVTVYLNHSDAIVIPEQA